MKPAWSHAWMLIAAAVVAAIALSCFSYRPTQSIESADALALVLEGRDGVVVFGRVRWIENGQEVGIGTTTPARSVELHLRNLGNRRWTFASVGPDGYFTWVLMPGEYEVPWIRLMDGEDSCIRDVDIRIVVPETRRAGYLGTLAVHTRHETHWLGWHEVTIEEYGLWNDCPADCERMLARLGLPEGSARMNFMERADEPARRWAEARKKMLGE